MDVTDTDDLSSNDVCVNGLSNLCSELYSYIKEADGRVIPHHAIKYGFQRVVIDSNDFNVVIYLLHYAHTFLQLGTIENWIQYRTCYRKHFIPLHELARSLGKRKSRVILKTHALSVCDVPSKIGTKVSVLKLEPEKYLEIFKENKICIGNVF